MKNTEMQAAASPALDRATREAYTARHAAASFWGEPTFTFTRAQALNEGVRVDVTNAARQIGFKLPVAMSAAAWSKLVAWSEADNQRQVQQDEPARLMDVMWMTYLSALRSKALSQLRYQLHVVPKDGHSRHPRLQTLSMQIGPGDNGEAVLTIMLPNED